MVSLNAWLVSAEDQRVEIKSIIYQMEYSYILKCFRFNLQSNESLEGIM